MRCDAITERSIGNTSPEGQVSNLILNYGKIERKKFF